MFVRQITRNTHNEFNPGGSNLVVVETPFAGDTVTNNEYTRACLRDSIINHTENPQAFHLTYTKVTDDTVPEQREIGLNKSFSIHCHAGKKVYYLDRGFSYGMELGMKHAIDNDIPVEFRVLTKDEKVCDFIEYANSIASSPSLALEFIKNNIENLKKIALPLGNDGSYTRYRIDASFELESVARTGYKESYFKDEDRLFMRKLLLETDMAPVMPEQLINQLYRPDLAGRMMNKTNGWTNACDGFAVLVDGMSLSDLITIHYTAKKHNKFCSYHSLDSVLDRTLKQVDNVSDIESIIKSHGKIRPDVMDHIGEIARLKQPGQHSELVM
ncbi:hypothetical protein LMH73_004555 [Vibrio splendidus]|nr:hypothetical protein [Vibrio splendidus]MCC4883295.1 hypothetical protein [Vibrio splendidus]